MPPDGPRSGGGSQRPLADGGNHGRVPHGARGPGRRRRQDPDVVTMILSFVLDYGVAEDADPLDLHLHHVARTHLKEVHRRFHPRA